MGQGVWRRPWALASCEYTAPSCKTGCKPRCTALHHPRHPLSGIEQSSEGITGGQRVASPCNPPIRARGYGWSLMCGYSLKQQDLIQFYSTGI